MHVIIDLQVYLEGIFFVRLDGQLIATLFAPFSEPNMDMIILSPTLVGKRGYKGATTSRVVKVQKC